MIRSASDATASLHGFAPCDGGRAEGRAAAARFRYEIAVSDSSECDSASKPDAATIVAGSVSVTFGSISAVVGLSLRDWIPVFAFIASRSKIAMPVASEPVPLVVGHAMCGFTGPGTDWPPPIGALM